MKSGDGKYIGRAMGEAAPRLAIVHSESSCGWGGQEIRILTESRGLLDRGHRVTLVAPEEAPITPAARDLGIPVVALPIARKRLGGLVSMRRWVMANRSAMDVLVTHSSTDSWLGALACASIASPPPIVRLRHVSTKVHDRIGTRWLYRRAPAYVVTTGEAVRQQLARDNGVDLARMTSIPTGIDLNRFVPGGRETARARLGLAPRPTLGIVATLRPWKGHVYLFDAIASAKDAWGGWQVIVVGGGPEDARLRDYARRAQLGGLVRFVGQQADVVPWLQSLDLLALPSYGEEGVPQAIMQAMACALPVVSTRVGAIAEAVDHGVTGLLVEPRAPSALAAALAALRDDPAQRAAFGAAGRERAEREFGIDRMLDGMEAVFRSVIAARSTP